LDDSDSSGEGGDDDDGIASSNEDAEEEPSLRPLISPYLFPRSTKAHPSPLSRMVKRQDWLSEDEEGDKEASPSPASTDSEGNSSGSSKKRTVGHHKRSGTRSNKTRSRSSTVASLAASSPAVRAPSSARKSLTKKGSHSSIRTVTAGDTSIKEGDNVLQEDATREPNSVDKVENNNLGHKRQVSEAVLSEFVLDDGEDAEEENYGIAVDGKISSRRKEAIEEAEQRYRELGWEALQEALGTFAEEVLLYLSP
jgi:WD repeat-containing protein 24